MADPDFIYDPDNWEVTYDYGDRQHLVDECGCYMSPGEVKTFNTLVFGPKKFLALVILSRDEDGEPDETDLQWFDTEEAARAATNSSTLGGAGTED